MQADDNRGIENVSGFDGTSDYVATDGNFDFETFNDGKRRSNYEKFSSNYKISPQGVETLIIKCNATLNL